MRQLRNFQTDRCYHLISRGAHRAFYLNEEERTRFAETRTEAYIDGVWHIITRSARGNLPRRKQARRKDARSFLYTWRRRRGKFLRGRCQGVSERQGA